jgi:uncharacterized membrane-anchored protein
MANKTKLLLFAVLAVVQLAVPLQMIFHQEDILDTGKVWKFRTAPVDPNDPFRGKYVYLNYDQTSFAIKSKDVWKSGQTVFANLTTDERGYAKVVSISAQRPGNPNYVMCKVDYVFGLDKPTLTISYPFDRFYVNEYKAAKAERIYNESSDDVKKEAYAIVILKEGEGVITDVMVDNISIKVLAAKK